MNTIRLSDPNSTVYDVTHNDREYQCQRVTGLIESTHKTPLQLVRWMVNSAVEAIDRSPEYHAGMLDTKEIKALAWNSHGIIGEEAMDTGTEVHKCLETGTSSDDPTVQQCLKAYDLFKKTYEPCSILHEMRLYSIKYLVAGSIDFIGTLNGNDKVIWILDWKTSSQVNENYLLQVSIYQKLLTDFIKMYKANRGGYELSVQAQMDKLLSHIKRGTKIRCGVVRLDKHIPVRHTTPAKYEFIPVEPIDMKSYQKEFELAVKLVNQRRARWERRQQAKGTTTH